MDRIRKKIPLITLIFVTGVLFFMPFFWFKPGQMDLGGDATRLFFYDPFTYLKNYSFFAVSPSGFGNENIGYFTVSFVILLTILLNIVHSSTLLIALFDGINLSVAFLACFGIIKVFLSDEGKTGERATFAGISAGLLYVFSQPMISGWDRVLTTHNQFFLNPLFFFFLLQYVRTSRVKYLLYILFASLLFSPNFSYAAAPSLFAFYPISSVFLFVYAKYIIKKNIVWKHIIWAFFGFLGIQAFNLIPQIVSMFSQGSVLNTTIFSSTGKFDRGLSYFLGILPTIKVSKNILGLVQGDNNFLIALLNIVFPLIATGGLLLNKKKSLLLTAVAFIFLLFFASANITQTWTFIYKWLFNVPGFSMFRNFYGQWQYTYSFFYAIFIGQALGIIFFTIVQKRYLWVFIFLGMYITISAGGFISGDLVNKLIWQSNGLHSFTQFDKPYTDAIAFIKKLPSEGKVLTFPLSDSGYQNIAGIGGVYQGPSTVSYLAGKQDFAGLDELDDFKNPLSSAIKSEDINAINRILGVMNIKYIFYDADPRVYDNYFPSFPYYYARISFPENQTEYKKFLTKLPLTKLAVFGGKYYIYQVNNATYFPTVFTTKNENFFPEKLDSLADPLSFTSLGGHSSVFTATPPKEEVSANTFTPVYSANPYLEMLKNPDQPLILQHSFSKTSPKDVFYPLIILKEEFSFRKPIPDINSYIDKKVFLAAKRLDELEEWQSDLEVVSDFHSVDNLMLWFKAASKSPLLSNEWWESYNTFDGVLARYTQDMEDIIARTNQQEESYADKVRQKFLINEYLLDHRKRFTMLIQGRKDPGEKKDIDLLVDNIFDHLSQMLQIPQITSAEQEYRLNTSLTNGALYVEKDMYNHALTGDTILLQGRMQLFPSAQQPEMNWIKIDTNQVADSMPIRLVEQNQKNLFDESTLISLDENEKGLTFREGLLWKTPDLFPNSYYVLSFDYNTNGTAYTVNIYQNETVNHKKSLQILLNNELKSRKWERYQALIKSDIYVDSSYIHIQKETLGDQLNSFQIKNLSLVFMPTPKMYVVTNNQRDQTLPAITISKINPTKYTVQIHNAKTPYLLVLNQSFNNRWLLFEKKDNSDNQFLDTIRNIFLKPIATSNHFTVNDYANAWYISPQDVNNKQNYTLTIEMTTQWYFYLGVVISLITFVIFLFFSGYLIIKYKMKQKD